jgi:hypothetical protein
MKKSIHHLRKILPYLVFCFFFVVLSCNIFAQEVVGISVGYEFIPFTKFADPDPTVPGMEDVELQLNTISVGAAFPLSFAEGKTLILNSINYSRIGFNWKNFDTATMGPRIDQAHSISYTAFLLQTLTDRWTLVMVVTPGLASDFEGEISTDDFTFDGVIGAMRVFGDKKNFTLGSGLAYTRDFGTPLPLPFIYIDWDITSKLNANGLLPQYLDVTYNLHPVIDIGVLASVNGNRYHGDPDKFTADNPQMKYSLGTIGPKAQIHIAKWVHLNVEGGYTLFRNFEFWDGPDKVSSFDMEQTYYLRASTVIGM